MGTVFDQIGIHGFTEDKEDAVLASLLTGDPVLLIGKQGTAKTALAEGIGNALRQRSLKHNAAHPDDQVKVFEYRIYDASKINFEDLIGFPNPAAMRRGKMEFIESPMTAWGADLIVFDEFNRQEPARQNNIFELVRSRRLMGKPTGTTWIINCMNPFGMAGTEELDDALIDRHQFFVHVSSFNDLDAPEQDKIVKHVGNSDSVALKMWTGKKDKFDIKKDEVNETFAAAGDYISKLMLAAANHYTNLHKEVGDGYALFVSRYWKSLDSEMQKKDWKVELSGRRAGMVHRALLAYRAIDLAKCDLNPRRVPRDLREMFKTVFKMTIPIGITTSNSQGISGDAANSIASNVEIFNKFFTTQNNQERAKASVDIIYELITTRDIQRKIELLIKEVDDPIAKNQVWSDLIKANKDISTYEGLRNAITIGLVSHLMTIKPEIVPAAMQSLLTKESANTLKLNDVCDSIKLKGQLSFYSKEIELQVNKYDNMFVKLQAKSLYENFCDQYKDKDINRSEFGRIEEQVRSQCSALERMLEANKIIV